MAKSQQALHATDRKSLKAEIEWLILLASGVEHKPAWVPAVTDNILDLVDETLMKRSEQSCGTSSHSST